MPQPHEQKLQEVVNSHTSDGSSPFTAERTAVGVEQVTERQPHVAEHGELRQVAVPDSRLLGNARCTWLVIDELSEPDGEDVDESNLLPRWGTALRRRGPTMPRVPWGRVALVREGNRVRATTRRVERFTLLLSPDEFDFDAPIAVEVDGKLAFEGRVEPSVATLLEWAARDNERTRIFAAELTLEP